MIKRIYKTLKESFFSVFPILIIVIILNFYIAFKTVTFFSFSVGLSLIMIGIALFTFGSDTSMEIIGQKIGQRILNQKKLTYSLFIIFFIGMVLTIAEPDLRALSEQMTSIPNYILISTVGIGAGLFFAVAILKIRYQWNLSKLFILLYLLVFIVLPFFPINFIPLAFDSGGVTTGPISVPFIVTLGLGLASLNISKKEKENSFGLVALCSIGPIIMVLILGLFYNIEVDYKIEIARQYNNINQVINVYLTSFIKYFKEVSLSLFPIIIIYILFQLFYKITNKKEIRKVVIGFSATLIGLTSFLLGANIGLMPVGYYIGNFIASSKYNYLLVPIGMIIGYVTVIAEPAVKVLNTQVEEITEGSIKKRTMNLFISIGVAFAVGFSIIRTFYGISILHFLIPGYLIALLLTFYTPQMFIAIAFDSGGAASGPMSAIFLLPIAIGSTVSNDGNVLNDAFGLIALVAMMPLIMVQILGIIYKLKQKYTIKGKYDLTIIDYDWSD